MSIRHIWAVSRKELDHIIRDRSTLFLVLFTPTLVLLLMAYALTVDIRNVPITIMDLDKSQASQIFIQKLTAGQDLTLYANASSMAEINSMFIRGEVKAAVIISKGFANQVQNMQGIPIQVIVDGTEPNSGNFAVDHITQRVEQ